MPLLDGDDYLRALADIVATEIEKEEPETPVLPDGQRWLLDRHSGWTEYLHQDPCDDNSFAIEFVADLEPTVERNGALYNEDNHGYTPSRDIRRVASIPPIMVEIWKRQWGVDPLAKGNEDLLRRLLNDSDLRKFRTAPGYIGRRGRR